MSRSESSRPRVLIPGQVHPRGDAPRAGWVLRNCLLGGWGMGVGDGGRMHDGRAWRGVAGGVAGRREEFTPGAGPGPGRSMKEGSPQARPRGAHSPPTPRGTSPDEAGLRRQEMPPREGPVGTGS